MFPHYCSDLTEGRNCVYSCSLDKTRSSEEHYEIVSLLPKTKWAIQWPHTIQISPMLVYLLTSDESEPSWPEP